MGFDLQTNLALKKQNWVELHNKMKKKQMLLSDVTGI